MDTKNKTADDLSFADYKKAVAALVLEKYEIKVTHRSEYIVQELYQCNNTVNEAADCAFIDERTKF